MASPGDRDSQSVLSVRNERGPWSIILAGGEGERVRPLVYSWLKKNRPKQYCAFVGTRSMLEHTFARADLLSSRERQITVIRRDHFNEAQHQFDGRPLNRVILQPENKGTGAGVFLPLTHIRVQDPEATVVIHPSDHFIHPDQKYIEVLRGAVQAAEMRPDRLILLGVVPDSPEPDYGWIVPEEGSWSVGGYSIKNVRLFLEKPTPLEAKIAMDSSGVWNTLICAVKLETLWRMGVRCFPAMMALFERFGKSIGKPHECELLDEIYREMPSCDFSSGLIGRVVECLSFLELDGVVWSDWGRAERICETLRRLHKTPAFPVDGAIMERAPEAAQADSGRRVPRTKYGE